MWNGNRSQGEVQGGLADCVHPEMLWWLGNVGHQDPQVCTPPTLGMAKEGYRCASLDKASLQVGETGKLHVQLLHCGGARRWGLCTVLVRLLAARRTDCVLRASLILSDRSLFPQGVHQGGALWTSLGAPYHRGAYSAGAVRLCQTLGEA